MPCGCNKKRLPAATPPQRWASIANKTYRNVTSNTLRSRNPRVEVGPDETISLTSEMINSSVRSWIRSGALLAE